MVASTSTQERAVRIQPQAPMPLFESSAAGKREKKMYGFKIQENNYYNAMIIFKFSIFKFSFLIIYINMIRNFWITVIFTISIFLIIYQPWDDSQWSWKNSNDCIEILWSKQLGRVKINVILLSSICISCYGKTIYKRLVHDIEDSINGLTSSN